MKKEYIIKLSEAEQKALEKLLRNGSQSVKSHQIARILLLSDVNGEGLTDEEIHDELGVSSRTVQRLRKRVYAEGLEKVFEKKYVARLKRRKFKGEEEAKLVALCCSEAPKGRARWSLRLLSERIVELKIIERVSYGTVRQTLKKTNLSLG